MSHVRKTQFHRLLFLSLVRQYNSLSVSLYVSLPLPVVATAQSTKMQIETILVRFKDINI